MRELAPAHYSFQIKNFSFLLETNVQRCESGVFETGGYKWKLQIYPSGNKGRNVKDHISVYLEMVETDSLPLGWEVNVNLKFFVFDHIRDKYETVQDANGGVRRYHKILTENGFDHFFNLDAFKDCSKGFLYNDCCVFGVEVFVVQLSGKLESISFKKEPLYGNYTWNISNFSAHDKIFHNSDVFIVEGIKWMLRLYPKEKDRFLALYLVSDDFGTLASGRSVLAKYTLRVKDQINSKHREITGQYWFHIVDSGYGWGEFMSLKDLKDTSNGYLVNDRLVIEADFEMISKS